MGLAEVVSGSSEVPCVDFALDPTATGAVVPAVADGKADVTSASVVPLAVIPKIHNDDDNNNINNNIINVIIHRHEWYDKHISFY